MGNNKMAAADLADLVNRIFTGPHGDSITDIYIQPGLPFRARVASQEWIVIDHPDHPGKSIVYPESLFDACMQMIFTKDDGQSGYREWREDVNAAGGSANPVFSMEVVDSVSAPSQNSDEAPVVPLPKLFRIRGTLQAQNSGQFGLILRCLREVPDSIEVVGLPPDVETFLAVRSGLILVTGPTGAGKSTTIAAMVNHINKTKAANIVLIEDPVEYLHKPNMSYIITREVGVDVKSYRLGVEQVLRFVPDVIGIGEIRDAETMRAAVRAGESGHLVIATMHAPTAIGAIRKAIGYLSTPGEQMAFGGCLVAILAQALVPQIKTGKALAYEILDCRPGEGNPKNSVQQAIGDFVSNNGEAPFKDLSDKFRRGEAGGPLSSHFSQSLLSLVKSRKVEPRRAAAIAGDRETVKELLELVRN